MSDIKNLVEDYTSTPVPDNSTVGALDVALIIIGVFVAVSTAITNAELGVAMGIVDYSKALGIATLILGLVSGMTAVVGAKTRLSTYKILEGSFGVKGAKVVSFIISISILGWFIVLATFFGETIQHAVQVLWNIEGYFVTYTIIGGVIMVTTAIFGFKAIDKLAMLASPILMIIILALTYLALKEGSWEQIVAYKGQGVSVISGATAIVGLMIVQAVVMPDVCRYANNPKAGAIGALCSMGLAQPLIALAIAITAITLGEKDLVLMMAAVGWGISAVLFVIFALWTTNTGNIYSSALGMSAVFPTIPKWLFIIVMGGVGVLLALIGFSRYFFEFLVVLGVSMPPIAGIYLADFFFVKGQSLQQKALSTGVVYSSFVIWLLATAVGYFTANEYFSLSGVSACDSLITAFFLYILYHRCLVSVAQRRQQV